MLHVAGCFDAAYARIKPTANRAYAIKIVRVHTLTFLYHINMQTGTPKETYKVPLMRIPGAIEAENYKIGGQGISYYNIFNGEPDTAVNNVLRQSELSIELADKQKTYAYTNVGEVVIGWTRPGEWMTYDVNTTYV
jgi:hypothetical protein